MVALAAVVVAPAEAAAQSASSPPSAAPPSAATPLVTAPSLTASLIAGGTTDYVYRGVSLSGERPTGFIFGEASNGFLYANGLLVGNDLGVDAQGRSIGNLEADLTIGITPSIGNVDFNFGGKYTGYPNGRDIIAGTLLHAERDFIEFFAGAKVNFDKTASLGATGFFTPDFYNETGRVRTLEMQGALALPAMLGVQPRLTGTVGIVRSDARDVVSPGHGYVYTNAGIDGTIDRLYFDLRYWTTDVRNIDAFGQRVALTVGVKFP